MQTVERLLQPVSADAPCGVWDPLVLSSLKRDIRTKQSPDGGEIPPDWRKVLKVSEAALEKTRHLEVCVIYAAARLRCDGLAGLADGIELISGLVQRYWGQLYPSLDPDDPGDPSIRYGCIENLSTPPGPVEDDSLQFILQLRKAPFACQRLMVDGERQDEKGADTREARLIMANALKINSVAVVENRGAALSMMADALRNQSVEVGENRAAVRRAMLAIEAMNASLQQLVPPRSAKEHEGPLPDLKLLIEQLQSIDDFYQAGEEKAGVVSAPLAESEQSTSPEILTPLPVAYSHTAVLPDFTGSAAIRGPEDVRRLLDLICSYYAKTEPSSPVPLILRRAHRLVGKDFMDVIQDLAESAVGEVRKITGVHDDNASGGCDSENTTSEST